MLDLPPLDPGIEIAVASRGITNDGLAQTDSIQVVPRAFVRMGRVQIGGQWKNVSSPVAKGIAAAFANATLKIDAFQLTLGAAYKFQTGVRGPADSDAFEFTGAVRRRFGRLGTRIAVVYSADDIGSTKRSLYVEGGPILDIGTAVKISANVGRRQRVGGPDHTVFNGGVSATLGKGLTIEARYHGTAQSELGEPYRGRLVLSARLGL
jgi:hypothetical protein